MYTGIGSNQRRTADADVDAHPLSLMGIIARESMRSRMDWPYIRMHCACMKNEEEFTMNKTELTAALAANAGLSKKDAEKALNAFVDVVTETLSKGDKVQVVGFGSFEVKERPARTARNPRTGEEIEIGASKAPVFKAGKALKDTVNK